MKNFKLKLTLASLIATTPFITQTIEWKLGSVPASIGILATTYVGHQEIRAYKFVSKIETICESENPYRLLLGFSLPASLAIGTINGLAASSIARNFGLNTPWTIVVGTTMGIITTTIGGFAHLVNEAGVRTKKLQPYFIPHSSDKKWIRVEKTSWYALPTTALLTASGVALYKNFK